MLAHAIFGAEATYGRWLSNVAPMTDLIGWLCVIMLLLMSLLVLYQWTLAVVSFLPRHRGKISNGRDALRFVILIPAHNEQSTLPRTLESLDQLRYPKERVDVVVIADRCDDATAVVARSRGCHCLERSNGPPGKGAAIAWSINELRKESVPFDALVMIDADTVVDAGLLEAFNEGLRSGRQIQQAYNYISNPWDTPFTRIIAVTSIMRNGLFYTGKSQLGLAGMLMGTGMCLGRQVIERYGWTAFSVGEDWEFSVLLLLAGEMIYFNPMARVLATESSGFKDAWTQRLRWASGRHAVAASGAWELLLTGLRQRRVYLVDAALTLLAPNYSSQAALAVFALIISWFLSGYPAWRFPLPWAALVMTSLAAYFLLGVALTQSPLRALAGIALIPLFVPWRMTIEVMGLLGYGRKQWHRTPRLPPSRQRPPT